MQAALMVSLLSVWMLVVLFFYLNRYTKREYFTVWTTAWLFYALWLTLNLRFPDVPLNGNIFKLKQCCVAISAVFLLWGSLRFLGLPVPQRLFGLFMVFLLVWTFVSPLVLTPALDPKLRNLEMQLPVFILLGLGSVFAGVCFYRLRKKMPFLGAGMLALGFLLWGLYLASYPLSQEDEHLYSAGFFMAAVLQLFIAVSMIVLVLEEVRYKNEQTLPKSRRFVGKGCLAGQSLTTEEQCRSLYDQVRVTEGLKELMKSCAGPTHGCAAGTPPRLGTNGRQRVVDIVGNPAGHLSQGTEAFLLHNHVLGPAQLFVSLLQAFGEAHLIIKVAALFLGGENFYLQGILLRTNGHDFGQACSFLYRTSSRTSTIMLTAMKSCSTAAIKKPAL